VRTALSRVGVQDEGQGRRHDQSRTKCLQHPQDSEAKSLDGNDSAISGKAMLTIVASTNAMKTPREATASTVNGAATRLVFSSSGTSCFLYPISRRPSSATMWGTVITSAISTATATPASVAAQTSAGMNARP